MAVQFMGLPCSFEQKPPMDLMAFFNVSQPTTSSTQHSAEFEVYFSDSCCKNLVTGDFDYCFNIGVVLLNPSSPGYLKVEPSEHQNSSDPGTNVTTEYSFTLY